MYTKTCPNCGKTVVLDGVMSDIVEFHRKFGIDYAGPPRELPPDLLKFRIDRLKSELKEYEDAKTHEERLDALIDLQYVLLGTAHLHGYTDWVWRHGWKVVHEANMKKVRAIKASDSKFGSTQDIVKPVDWEAPSHKAHLEAAKQHMT